MIARPATGSAQPKPAAASPIPIAAPAETRASTREWMPSAASAVLRIERPTRTLYSDTARLATTPKPAAKSPKGRLPTATGFISLRIDAQAAAPAVTTITSTIRSVATSSIWPKPAGKRRVAGRRPSQKEPSRIAVVSTSPALWRASARTPAECPPIPAANSTAEAIPSAIALTTTARTASRSS